MCIYMYTGPARVPFARILMRDLICAASVYRWLSDGTPMCPYNYNTVVVYADRRK